MKSSEKQVKWAKDIKAEAILAVQNLALQGMKQKGGEAGTIAFRPIIKETIDRLNHRDEAKWWIDNRDGTGQQWIRLVWDDKEFGDVATKAQAEAEEMIADGLDPVDLTAYDGDIVDVDSNKLAVAKAAGILVRVPYGKAGERQIYAIAYVKEYGRTTSTVGGSGWSSTINNDNIVSLS